MVTVRIPTPLLELLDEEGNPKPRKSENSCELVVMLIHILSIILFSLSGTLCINVLRFLCARVVLECLALLYYKSNQVVNAAVLADQVELQQRSLSLPPNEGEEKAESTERKSLRDDASDPFALPSCLSEPPSNLQTRAWINQTYC